MTEQEISHECAKAALKAWEENSSGLTGTRHQRQVERMKLALAAAKAKRKALFDASH